MMQFRLFVLFACLFTVFSAENVNAIVCRPFPDCEDLGFDKTKSDCQENGFPYIECPFNRDLVYCPGNCDDYPYDSCDATIGKCKQCAIGGKWKHIDCKPGYTLNEAKDKCESTLNNCYGFVEGNLDGRKGSIGSCSRGTIPLFMYGVCNEGWELKNGDCVKNICADEYDKHGYTLETCPNNVQCDTCKEGLVTKTKMTCPDGLFLQPKGDIAGEDYKCSKHPLGYIAFYCKEKSNINNLGENLDVDGDQIISLGYERYDEARAQGCEAIGVVFYNEDADGDGEYDYKIVGLKNIDYANPNSFLEAASSSSAPSSGNLWSNCSSNEAKCNVDTLEDINDGVNLNAPTLGLVKNIDGKDNTKKIYEWAKNTGYRVPIAYSTLAYYPRLNMSDSNIICSKGTACGRGNWYLPSMHEMYYLVNGCLLSGALCNNTLAYLEGKGVGQKLHGSMSTSIESGNNTVGVRHSGLFTYNWGKDSTFFRVRPILNLSNKEVIDVDVE